MRHQFPQSRDVLWLGRSHHRPHPGDTVTAGKPVTEAFHQAGKVLMDRPLGSFKVLDVHGPGVAGADQRENSCVGCFRRLDQWFKRIATHQRVGRECIRAESRDFPEWSFSTADHRLAVGPRRDWNVTPLAVSDHQKAALTCCFANFLKRLPAGPA